MKKKKKSTVIQIRIHPDYFKSNTKHLGIIDREAKKQAKEILDHFKTDGWDLSLEHYVNEVLSPLIGRSAREYIQAKLLQLISKKYPKAYILYNPLSISKGDKRK